MNDISSDKLKSISENNICFNFHFFKYFCVATTIGIFNIFACTHLIAALMLVSFQILTLTVLFLKKKFTSYICYHLIFTTMSLEYEYYLGTGSNYGFKGFSLFGINLPVLFLLPIVAIAAINYKNIWYRLKDKKLLRKVLLAFLILAFLGVFMGFLSLIFNVNEIQKMSGFITLFIISIYEKIGLTLFPILAFTYVLSKNEVKKLYYCAIAILCGIVITMLFSFIFKVFGKYANADTLFVTIAFFYTPFLALFAIVAKDYRDKLLLGILGVLGWGLAIIYTLMGKLIIVALAIPVLAVFVMLQKKTRRVLLFTVILGGAGIFACYALITSNSFSTTFEWKLNQAKEMLMFWKDGWWENMDGSPKTRIYQFIQITVNYLKEPIWALFGKGIMGTYYDYGGYFSTFKENEILSAFSVWQWKNSVFYTVHETPNVLYLSNGLYGLAFLTYFVIMGLKHYRKSIFLIIGLVWLLLFFGWSVSISLFGIMCLLLGVFEVDNKCAVAARGYYGQE